MTKPIITTTGKTNQEIEREGKQADKVLKGKGKLNEDNSEYDMKGVVNMDAILNPPVETLTYEQVKKLYPKNITRQALEQGVDLINQAILGMNSGVQDYFRQNAVEFLEVMKGNKTNSFKDYVNAVKFITYKNTGESTITAWTKIFPEKVARMEKEGQPMSYLYSYANTFARSTLVTKMQAMMLVPTHILYHDIFHEAVMTQVSIMKDPTVSPKVRSDSAHSLMTHLKQPEVKQMELSIGVNESNVLSQFTESMAKLAESQYKAIQSGSASVIDLGEQEIIEGEIVNASEES